MNLLLLRDEDFLDDQTARLTGRRLAHARDVLQAAAGDALRVGRLGGQVGSGEVTSLSDEELILRVALSGPPPARPGVDLLLAVPRPKALRKVLPAVASLGVDRLWLLNAARVEKSYFGSRWLAPDALEGLLCEGLEQARDTRLPEVLVRERFRPFVEDELPALAAGARKLVAHPDSPATSTSTSNATSTSTSTSNSNSTSNANATPPTNAARPRPARLCVAVGPEGGWVPFELELLRAAGFEQISLGPRILRVEVAVPYLLGLLAQAATHPGI